MLTPSGIRRGMLVAVVGAVGLSVEVADAAVQTIVVSVTSSGSQVKDGSYPAGISRDGRLVLFASNAGRLTRHDTNRTSDVLLHHRVTGRTELISVALNGKAGNGPSFAVTVTPNGRYVLFQSWARNLTHDFDWACCESDVFVRDRRRGVTRRASELPGVHS